ncbi:MAG: H-NS histone family protein [Acidobacteria bacterium]|nr:H-NS histone family protein [Acidobacteriota bacterium]
MPDREESTAAPQTFSRYCLRLERRAHPFQTGQRPCHRPSDAAALLHELLHEEPAEVVGALLLDKRQTAIGYTLPYRGILDRVLVEPRGVLAPALLANASYIILFHNHPSGDLAPSREDLDLTGRIEDAGEILGITVMDHLILGESPNYYSIFQARRAAERRKPRSRKVKPKYRHPKTGATWAGRGRMARWLQQELAAGASLEDFRLPS